MGLFAFAFYAYISLFCSLIASFWRAVIHTFCFCRGTITCGRKGIFDRTKVQLSNCTNGTLSGLFSPWTNEQGKYFDICLMDLGIDIRYRNIYFTRWIKICFRFHHQGILHFLCMLCITLVLFDLMGRCKHILLQIRHKLWSLSTNVWLHMAADSTSFVNRVSLV